MTRDHADANDPASAILTERRSEVYHDVWMAAVATATALRGWSVTRADSRNGTITLITADLLGRHPETAELEIGLDAVGLTIITLSRPEDSGDAARTRIRRRGARLLRRLGRLLARRSQ